MSRWIRFNENPVARNVGDCAVRAVSVALGVDWETAYAILCANGYRMADMPSSNSVIAATLREYGFNRAVIPNECPNCYTVGDFADENPVGVYVLGTGNHVVAVVDGNVVDSWDSREEIPQYYWYRGV